MQGTKNGAKAEDLADDVQEIEEVILKGNKKIPNDFNEREILEYLKRYNFHGHYRLIDLKKIWLRSIVLKLSIKELTDFVKTGSLLKIERKYLTEEMNFFAKQVKNKFAQQTSKLIKGKNCLRDFDINNCGGEILNLDWQHIEIFDEGLDMVKAHLERFESVEANRKMINRLEKIIDKEIPATDWDRRFYTHEIREYRRYENLGYEEALQKNIPDEIYENAHSGTLEDFKLKEIQENGKRSLYDSEIKAIEFYSDEERKLLEL